MEKTRTRYCTIRGSGVTPFPALCEHACVRADVHVARSPVQPNVGDFNTYVMIPATARPNATTASDRVVATTTLKCFGDSMECT